ncbi:MAG TPA: ComEC/Rec2 family competence protein [Candidatus Colwellbacteria bacterium]|nr:ComEC/Rec2 family competence protein [Candidatus Colwellbacteria bacterium]
MKPAEMFFYASLFFLAGVFLASFNVGGVSVLALVAASSGGFLWLAEIRRSRKWKTLARLALLILLGCFYFHFRESLSLPRIPLGEETTFVAKVIAEPESREKSQVFRLGLEPPWKGEVASYSRLYPEYAYGDLLRVTGSIKENGYGGYGISFPEVVLLQKSQGSSLMKALFGFKDSLVSGLRRVLPVSEAGFSIAMMFGDESLIDQGFADNLKKTGTSHLVALSGYNVLIVVQGVRIFLSSLGLRRRSFFLSVLVVSGFVLMTGAGASVTRAGIMAVLSMMAKENSRFYSMKNTVAFTGLLMSLYNPRFIVFDLGFQLSFLAFFGVSCLASFLKEKLRFEDRGFCGWKENAVQTLSAQIMVAPLLFFKTGGFSPLAIFPNILILPAVPLIMLLGFIVAFASVISLPLAVIFAFLLRISLSYAESVINLSARFM